MNKRIDMEQEMPRHVAIIMDGNGRWAKKWFMTRKAGHRAGAQTLRKLAEKMNMNGFKILTIYTFSTENWTRSENEVNELMDLMRDYIQQYIDDSKKNNMRINVIGNLSRLPIDLQEKINHLKELTKNHDGMCVNMALNYGARDEIVRAIKNISELVANNKIKVENITESFVSSQLDTAEFSDPDLIIRTSGEMRLSNFLLWQASYAELYFSDKLWPDFTYDDLMEIVEQYQGRQRRFGGRK